MEEESSGPREKLKEMVPWIKRRVKRACTRKMLHRRVPILDWLPRYSRSDFMGDLVAGITVGLTVIPQSLAYSNVAGLPAQVSVHVCMRKRAGVPAGRATNPRESTTFLGIVFSLKNGGGNIFRKFFESFQE